MWRTAAQARKSQGVDLFAHRACTFILPDGRKHPWPAMAPRFLRERTHGCWCSSWRLTRNGLRVWRRGAWRKALPGDLRRVKGRNLERAKLMGIVK